jgi:hypothetical protein
MLQYTHTHKRTTCVATRCVNRMPLWEEARIQSMKAPDTHTSRLVRDFRLPPQCTWDMRSSGITQLWVVVLYRRFGKNHRSHLQGRRSPRRLWLLDAWKLKSSYCFRAAGDDRGWNAATISRRGMGTTVRVCMRLCACGENTEWRTKCHRVGCRIATRGWTNLTGAQHPTKPDTANKCHSCPANL